jgi:hypothetical protein
MKLSYHSPDRQRPLGFAFKPLLVYRHGRMNTTRATGLCFGIIALLSFAWVNGQAAPGQPATQPAHIAVIPPGMHALKVGDRTFFCDPADDDWIKQASAKSKPATRPTTMPSDLLKIVLVRGPTVTKEILADFASIDPKPVTEMLNTMLIGQLKKLEALKPVIIFMPTTQKKLNDALMAGWTDPRYRYVPINGNVQYDTGIHVSMDSPMDDQVIFVDTTGDTTPEAKRDRLSNIMTDFDAKYLGTLSYVSEAEVRNAFVSFINVQYMQPLKLPVNLAWFGNAVSEVYSLKYTAEVIGVSRDALNQGLMRDNPNNPFNTDRLDLLVSPLDPSAMRPQFQAALQEASALKGARAVLKWVSAGGDGVLAKTIPALRNTPPANAQDLVKRIKDATAIDLTPQLSTPPAQ